MFICFCCRDLIVDCGISLCPIVTVILEKYLVFVFCLIKKGLKGATSIGVPIRWGAGQEESLNWPGNAGTTYRGFIGAP